MWAALAGQLLKTIGTTGSNVATAKAIYDKADQARRNQLERRAAMGDLGLSDEEVLRAQELAVSPVQAQLRELNMRNQLGTSIQDVGSGSAARTALASQDAQSRALNQAGAAVARANEDARQAQERELQDLRQAEDQRKRAMRAAILQGIAGSASGVEQIANMAGQRKADKKFEDMLLEEGADTFGDDSGIAASLMSSYGGEAGFWDISKTNGSY